MHSENIRKRGHNCNPLLKVPPARRGNRVGAPFAVPLAKRGENLHAHSVPLAKRGEPKGGGQLMNFGRAIGIRPAGGGQ
jgi:hypothetical protein